MAPLIEKLLNLQKLALATGTDEKTKIELVKKAVQEVRTDLATRASHLSPAISSSFTASLNIIEAKYLGSR